jgi:glycosyltransferase involved in cell wall biosynthesis
MHLHEKLRDTGVKIKVVTEFLPRNSYLELINNAKVAVLLPNRTEGFFLPALEAMALETIVICPDCIGNRRFCIDGRNCFRPNYTIEDIAAAVKKALSLDTETREQLLVNATRTRLDHSLERERDAFLLILENLEKVWGGLRRDKGRSDVNG